ncbi:MAG: tetratricopeptide repeat protein [ANME-2 cluster archaeon]|nr:tetratricopeptide repeat protein [ANME-2 cluster archaeon]
MDPDNPVHAILGRIYENLLKFNDAVEEYEKALELFNRDHSKEALIDKYARVMLGGFIADENWQDISTRLNQLQQRLKKPRKYGCARCGGKMGIFFDSKTPICEYCSQNIDRITFGT